MYIRSTLLSTLLACLASALGQAPLPYRAEKDRERQIMSGYQLVTSGMTPAKVKQVLGSPDSVTLLYEPKIKNPNMIGYTYWYFIQKLKDTGSLAEKGWIGVGIRTDLNHVVSQVDTYELPKENAAEQGAAANP